MNKALDLTEAKFTTTISWSSCVLAARKLFKDDDFIKFFKDTMSHDSHDCWGILVLTETPEDVYPAYIWRLNASFKWYIVVNPKLMNFEIWNSENDVLRKVDTLPNVVEAINLLNLLVEDQRNYIQKQKETLKIIDKRYKDKFGLTRLTHVQSELGVVYMHPPFGHFQDPIFSTVVKAHPSVFEPTHFIVGLVCNKEEFPIFQSICLKNPLNVNLNSPDMMELLTPNFPPTPVLNSPTSSMLGFYTFVKAHELTQDILDTTLPKLHKLAEKTAKEIFKTNFKILSNFKHGK